ncbi:DUF192 domain-containing protein [Kamptonema cortianum]|nr:DUF192 domain-containing protein [Kamptonema cortianum]
MAEWRTVKNRDTGQVVLGRARLCVSFWSHFKGLQLAPSLPDDEGLLFVTKRDNRTETAIHMFFMRFSIGVIWIDSQGRVVDKRLAKPWRPYYAPSQPAQYFIEANPGILDRVSIGDHLVWDDPSATAT